MLKDIGGFKPNFCGHSCLKNQMYAQIKIATKKQSSKSLKIQHLTRRQNIEKEIVCARKQMTAQTSLNLSAGFGSAYNQKENPCRVTRV